MSDLQKPIAGLPLDDAVEALVTSGSPRDLAVELLDYVAPALELDRTTLFEHYLGWRLGRARREDDRLTLERAVAGLEGLQARVGQDWGERWARLVETARETLREDVPTADASPLECSARSELAQRYFDALMAADRRGAVQGVMDALDADLTIRELYLDVFQPVLSEVGRLWEIGELTIGQEHYCTAVTQSIMAQLYPRLFSGDRNGHRVVASSVQGNLHEIGIRMVADLLEMEGWDTHFLGADLPEDSVVEAVEACAPDAVALSVTLSAQLPSAARTISGLRSSSKVKDVSILVGGRALGSDDSIARTIGADAWAPDAVSALSLLDDLVGAA